MSVFVADVAVDTGKLAVGPPYAVDNQAESGHPSEPTPGSCLPVEEVDQEKHTHADIYYNHEYAKNCAHNACAACAGLFFVAFVTHNKKCLSVSGVISHAVDNVPQGYIRLTLRHANSSTCPLRE